MYQYYSSIYANIKEYYFHQFGLYAHLLFVGLIKTKRFSRIILYKIQNQLTHRIKYLYRLLANNQRLLLSSVTAVAITLFLGGYYLALTNAESIQLNNVREELKEYQLMLAGIRSSSEQQESLMLLKLSTIHAQITRIEAMGQYLSERYDLTSEFNFSAQAGIGGVLNVNNDKHQYINELQLNEVTQNTDKLIRETQIKLDLMLEELTKIEAKKAKEPQGWPVDYRLISSRFGYRVNPFSGESEFHKGLDISGAVGSNIYAVANGIVKRAGHYSHYGNLVEIQHADGYRTLYAHNSHILVKKNDMVKKGQTIALIGNTGRSTGPHLHFEVLKNGKRINPQSFISGNN